MRAADRSGLRSLAAVGVAVLLGGCAHAVRVDGLSVDDVIAKHVAARGGKAKIQAVRSVRATGTADAGGGRVARVTREIQRPGRIRLEFTYQGLTGVYAHDGTTGWEIAPFRGKFEPESLPPETARAAVDQLDLEGPLVDWRAKGHKILLVGRTTIAGRGAYELVTTLAGGAMRRDFVDAETFLLARSEAARPFRGRNVVLETSFGDYREVAGLRFPYLIETRAKGRPQTLRIVVEKVELDPPIDEARFRKPS